MNIDTETLAILIRLADERQAHLVATRDENTSSQDLFETLMLQRFIINARAEVVS